MEMRNNVFPIIKNLHIACVHKGKKKTDKKVSEHYANIPITIIESLINVKDVLNKVNKVLILALLLGLLL